VTPQSASQLLVRLVRDQFMCWPLTGPFGKSYCIICVRFCLVQALSFPVSL